MDTAIFLQDYKDFEEAFHLFVSLVCMVELNYDINIIIFLLSLMYCNFVQMTYNLIFSLLLRNSEFYMCGSVSSL